MLCLVILLSKLLFSWQENEIITNTNKGSNDCVCERCRTHSELTLIITRHFPSALKSIRQHQCLSISFFLFSCSESLLPSVLQIPELQFISPNGACFNQNVRVKGFFFVFLVFIFLDSVLHCLIKCKAHIYFSTIPHQYFSLLAHNCSNYSFGQNWVMTKIKLKDRWQHLYF